MKLLIPIFVMAVYAMANNIPANTGMLTLANEQFTAKMFNVLVTLNPNKSFVQSAFSVLSPLGQLALASVGDSHDEIYRSIGVQNNDEAVKGAFQALDSRIKAVKGVELKTASRLYIPIGYQVNDQFALLSRQVFDSDVKNVDFLKNGLAAAEINSWVENQTNRRIKDLVDPASLGPETRAVLVNALYFKGKWASPFNARSTVNRDFYINRALTVQVPTMYQKSSFLYGESQELNAKLLEMPYDGAESSFLIILPNEIDGLEALTAKISNPEILNRAVRSMSYNEVEVFLPKFKIETTTNLKTVLQRLGIEKLFKSEEARLDNLVKGQQGLFISDAIQKAFIEVNEEGAEAAAANVFHGMGFSPFAQVIQVRLFNADKPFYYELRSRGVKLFSGQYII